MNRRGGARVGLTSLLVLALAAGCGGGDAGVLGGMTVFTPGLMGQGIVAQVNGQMQAQADFDHALQYERWDDAIKLAEDLCARATKATRPGCLNHRVQAYEARAFAHARGAQWDSAISDELKASEAADDLTVAYSEYESYLRSAGTPEAAVNSLVKVNADLRTKAKAVSTVRLNAYRAHALADSNVELVARVSGEVQTQASTPALTPGAAAAPGAGSDFLVGSPQPRSYALVVGIESYRDVPAATGAHADAVRFAELLHKTMGLSDANVKLALDDRATRADILGALSWLGANVPAGGRVYFYYGGHGAPSADQSTYLVPYDGDPRNLALSGVSIAEVMRALGATRAREVLAVVDSCFSGAGGRSVLPPGARPLVRVKEAAPAKQVALFTASGGDEISGPAPGERGGLFTKFVTLGLGSAQADTDGDGQITLKELADWVGPRVAREAKRDSREQHPKLAMGGALGAGSSFIVEYGLPAAK